MNDRSENAISLNLGLFIKMFFGIILKKKTVKFSIDRDERDSEIPKFDFHYTILRARFKKKSILYATK